MSEANIPDTLADLVVPIDDVQPADRNPRQGDIGAICESLDANGQYRPIVVNSRDGQILAGNHTWQAAKHLGWDGIAVTYVDADEEQAERIKLVDNRASDLAGYDDHMLTELLEELTDQEGADALLGTGFDGDDLDELLRLTGAYGDEAVGFLDDFLSDGDDDEDVDDADDTPKPQSGDVDGISEDADYFTLTFAVDKDQRDTVKKALKRAQDTWELTNSIEALVRIARQFLDTDLSIVKRD